MAAPRGATRADPVFLNWVQFFVIFGPLTPAEAHKYKGTVRKVSVVKTF
jgi:hypothetical protein